MLLAPPNSGSSSSENKLVALAAVGCFALVVGLAFALTLLPPENKSSSSPNSPFAEAGAAGFFTGTRKSSSSPNNPFDEDLLVPAGAGAGAGAGDGLAAEGLETRKSSSPPKRGSLAADFMGTAFEMGCATGAGEGAGTGDGEGEGGRGAGGVGELDGNDIGAGEGDRLLEIKGETTTLVVTTAGFVPPTDAEDSSPAVKVLLEGGRLDLPDGAAVTLALCKCAFEIVPVVDTSSSSVNTFAAFACTAAMGSIR